MLRFHAFGNWTERQVFGDEVPSTRLIVPQVEKIIDETWEAARSQPGVNLFDGPMCRLESWAATPKRLELRFSRTSYKPFVGTNLYHADLADQFGSEILANPVGVSPALETSDGWLMFGRRNASVAYYPHRIHPFAGALEPRDGSNVFRAVERELVEELALKPGTLQQIHCVGIAEDQRLRQTELIFSVQVDRSRAKIEAGVKKDEHQESWSVPAQSAAIDAALANVETLTPVATAALLLWGRQNLGTGWFDQRCPEGRYAPPNRGGPP